MLPVRPLPLVSSPRSPSLVCVPTPGVKPSKRDKGVIRGTRLASRLTRGSMAGAPGLLGAPGEVPQKRGNLRPRPRWRHDAADDRDLMSGLSRRGYACGPYDQREGGRGVYLPSRLLRRTVVAAGVHATLHGGLTIHMGNFASAPSAPCWAQRCRRAASSRAQLRGEVRTAAAGRGPHEEARARELLYIHDAGNCCTLAVGPVSRKRVDF